MFRREMARTLALTLLLAIGCSTPATGGGEPAADGRAAKADDVPVDPKLLDTDAANATAPDQYDVEFTTTEGKFVVTVHRDWAPIGADRFYNLVSIGYYDDSAFFRVVQGFMVQFGIHGVPKVSGAWKPMRIADDPRTQSNRRGTISFANSGPNSRTTQVFINYSNTPQLDSMGFAPFGEVTQGFDVVQKLHGGYGDGPPSGPGPDQRDIERRGNAYLKQRFPELDWIETAKIVSK
jgi:peptidyl-prolyl cis-trans isomerase A (cyclophilin A)